MLNSLKVAFFLAFKSLKRSNKATIILTPIIIGVSFINIAFSSALFSGMLKTLDNQLINNWLSHVIIRPERGKQYLEDVQKKRKLIESIPGVIATASHYKLGAQFTFDRWADAKNIESGGYQVISVIPSQEKKVIEVYKHVIKGKFLDDSDTNSVVIGVEIAGGAGSSFNENSLKGPTIGDKIYIIFPNGVRKKFIVKGIYKTGIDGIDMAAYITQKEMESILGTFNQASEINVKLSSPDNYRPYISKIQKLIIDKEKISGWDQFLTMTKQMKSSFVILNGITVFISLIIAAATIFIVIFINVINKKRQIGILKAIGVSKNIIIVSYLIQAVFYVIIGTLIGVFVLYVILDAIFKSYPLDMGFGKVSLDIVFSDILSSLNSLIIVSVISGFIPAWKTSKEPIIKAIWGA